MSDFLCFCTGSKFAGCTIANASSTEWLSGAILAHVFLNLAMIVVLSSLTLLPKNDTKALTHSTLP